MKQNHLPLVFGFTLLFLAGCSFQRKTPLPSNEAYPGPQDSASFGQAPASLPDPPMDAPAPRPGRASISGVLYSYLLPHVIGGTMFYLTPAVGEDRRQMPTFLIGPHENAEDVRGYTNSNGQFVLDNVPPGNYYLIVWAPYDWVPAETSRADATPLLLELAPDQKKPLGIVYLGWQ